MSESGPGGGETAREPREMCYRCLKARVVCVCASVRVVENRIGVTILQHPREYRHPIGTARFLRLGLRCCRVIVPWANEDGELRRDVSVPPGAALLYPGARARELSDLEEAARPSHLVVLDGTWRHVRRLYRDNAWLHALPMVALEPPAPSRYRIRPEPAAHCLSTVESVAAALGMLEPATIGLDALVAAFEAMIDEQIRCANGGRVKREKTVERVTRDRRRRGVLLDPVTEGRAPAASGLRDRAGCPV